MDLSGEQLRHQYLEAIGISSWLPRARLPGAAPSPDWVARFRYPWTEGAGTSDSAETEVDGGSDEGHYDQGYNDRPAETSQSAASQRASQTGADARVQARASLSALDGADGGSTKGATGGAVTAATELQQPDPEPARRAAVTQPPRVKLAFVLVGDLLIVDSLPPAARQGFSAQHQRLLSGIARAIGIAERPSDASLLSWPVLAGPTLNQGPDELTKAVRRKLELTLALSSIKRAILLGESAAQWLLEREESLDALRGIRFSLRPEMPCIATVSLSQALQLPELKAELWRDIQPLLK